MRKLIKNKKIISLLVLLGIFALFTIAWAAELNWPPSPLGAPALNPDEDNITDLIRYLYEWGIALGGIVAFIALLIAGFQYLSSMGNPASMKEAKSRIISAVGGLALLLGSWLILNTINPDLTTLRDLEFRPERWGEGEGSFAIIGGEPCEFTRVYCDIDYNTENECKIDVKHVNKLTEIFFWIPFIIPFGETDVGLGCNYFQISPSELNYPIYREPTETSVKFFKRIKKCEFEVGEDGERIESEPCERCKESQRGGEQVMAGGKPIGEAKPNESEWICDECDKRGICMCICDKDDGCLCEGGNCRLEMYGKTSWTQLGGCGEKIGVISINTEDISEAIDREIRCVRLKAAERLED